MHTKQDIEQFYILDDLLCQSSSNCNFLQAMVNVCKLKPGDVYEIKPTVMQSLTSETIEELAILLQFKLMESTGDNGKNNPKIRIVKIENTDARLFESLIRDHLDKVTHSGVHAISTRLQPKTKRMISDERSLVLQAFQEQKQLNSVIKTRSQVIFEHFNQYYRPFRVISVRVFEGYGPNKSLLFEEKFNILADVNVLEQKVSSCLQKKYLNSNMNISDNNCISTKNFKLHFMKNAKLVQLDTSPGQTFLAAGCMPPGINLHLI